MGERESHGVDRMSFWKGYGRSIVSTIRLCNGKCATSTTSPRRAVRRKGRTKSVPSLLALPLELQQMIYCYVGHDTRVRLGQAMNKVLSIRTFVPSLFLVSRRTYINSRDSFYRHAILVFDVSSKEGVWGVSNQSQAQGPLVQLGKNQLERAMELFRQFEIVNMWETRTRYSMFGCNRVAMILDTIWDMSAFSKVDVTFSLSTMMADLLAFPEMEAIYIRHLYFWVGCLIQAEIDTNTCIKLIVKAKEVKTTEKLHIDFRRFIVKEVLGEVGLKIIWVKE